MCKGCVISPADIVIIAETVRCQPDSLNWLPDEHPFVNEPVTSDAAPQVVTVAPRRL